MESDSSCPLFTAGHEIASFLVSCGILTKAWEESRLANNLESYSLNEYEGVAYVAFPSFHKVEDFIVKDSKYGEGNIQAQNKIFSGYLNGNDDQPALVHQGALKLFLHIMENTDFQEKMQIYTDSKQRKLKTIIFVGHSFGGAVATLATLWVLEKRLRQSSPFCITFGAPLVGDIGLVKAVGRENWAGNFFHVVSNHDIVPRMLLAPFESIVEPLIEILPYWKGIMANDSKTVPDHFIQNACRALLNNVLQYTNTVADHRLDSLRELDGVIKRSPYRPFGTYMFCSGEGAACIDNSETLLKILCLTMQTNEKSYDNIVQDCLSEHIGYDSVLKHAIEMSIIGRAAKPDSESSYKMGMALQLEAIGVGAQSDYAPIALQIAGDIENTHNRNVAKLAIELSQKQCIMAELEWYKECCEKQEGIPYYDSFKKHDKKDIDVNFCRERLARFWDEIIEKWEKHELPSDFQSQNKWINTGTAYRRLVEPLDIAHYYRMSEGKGKGNYLSDERPTRHKVLQKWMEEKENTRNSRGQRDRTNLASLIQDSCFWAHVEEALKDLDNLKQGQHQKLENLEIFEDYVTRMINNRSISSDVFLEASNFMHLQPVGVELQPVSPVTTQTKSGQHLFKGPLTSSRTSPSSDFGSNLEQGKHGEIQGKSFAVQVTSWSPSSSDIHFAAEVTSSSITMLVSGSVSPDTSGFISPRDYVPAATLTTDIESTLPSDRRATGVLSSNCTPISAPSHGPAQIASPLSKMSPQKNDDTSHGNGDYLPPIAELWSFPSLALDGSNEMSEQENWQMWDLPQYGKSKFCKPFPWFSHVESMSDQERNLNHPLPQSIVQLFAEIENHLPADLLSQLEDCSPNQMSGDGIDMPSAINRDNPWSNKPDHKSKVECWNEPDSNLLVPSFDNCFKEAIQHSLDAAPGNEYEQSPANFPPRSDLQDGAKINCSTETVTRS